MPALDPSGPRAASRTRTAAGRVDLGLRVVDSGGGGIRTRGPLSRTPVFKTGALSRSATPPANRHRSGQIAHIGRPDWAIMRAMADRLGPYLCDLHRAWLADDPRQSFRQLDASLLFFDIAGFTPLAERLARRGKAGVEQLNRHAQRRRRAARRQRRRARRRHAEVRRRRAAAVVRGRAARAAGVRGRLRHAGRDGSASAPAERCRDRLAARLGGRRREQAGPDLIGSHAGRVEQRLRGLRRDELLAVGPADDLAVGGDRQLAAAGEVRPEVVGDRQQAAVVGDAAAGVRRGVDPDGVRLRERRVGARHGTCDRGERGAEDVVRAQRQAVGVRGRARFGAPPLD